MESENARIDVAQRMREIRERVLREAEEKKAATALSETQPSETPPPLAAEPSLPPPPPQANLAALRQYVQEVSQKWAVQERPFVSRVPFFGPFIAWFRDQWNRVSAKWYVLLILQQQVDFNLAVSRAIGELAQMVECLHDQVARLQEGVSRQEQLDGRIAKLQATLDQQADVLRELTVTVQSLREALHTESNRTQALQEAMETRVRALQEAIETKTRVLDNLEGRLAAWQAEIATRVQSLEPRQGALEAWHRQAQEQIAELREQQKDDRRFYRGLLRELVEALPGREATVTAKDEALGAKALSSETRLDYYDFNRLFTGRDAVVADLYQRYLPYYSGCRNVLDIGCGRGTFLELLEKEGIGGYGIDVDEEMVALCLGKGLRVYRASALEHLRALEDESLDGIFMGHLVEHLPLAELLELLQLCYRKLEPERYLVFETPNTRSLFVLSQTFYRDPTHRAPVHPETYQFLASSQGFRRVEILYSNPVPEGLRPSTPKLENPEERGAFQASVAMLSAAIDKLSEIIYGDQNVAIVARK